MDFKKFFKGIMAWFILNVILFPSYCWIFLVVAMGIGAIENMSIIEKLPFLLVSFIPCAIEYVVIYFIAYKRQKFDVIFNKYIIATQVVLVLVFIFSFSFLSTDKI